MKKASLILIVIFSFLVSCDSGLKKEQPLPYSDASSVWENLYKNTNSDNKRIALSGYISLDNLRERGDEYYCQFVDNQGNHLMWLTIKRNMKNSLKLVTSEAEKVNNIQYIEFDETNSFILDNEGNKIPLSEKILLSFDIIYTKHVDTGKYPNNKVEGNEGEALPKDAKKGEQYHLFHSENIRIDKM